jgi:hypothetical protein
LFSSDNLSTSTGQPVISHVNLEFYVPKFCNDFLLLIG